MWSLVLLHENPVGACVSLMSAKALMVSLDKNVSIGSTTSRQRLVGGFRGGGAGVGSTDFGVAFISSVKIVGVTSISMSSDCLY
jgi:hypothetical protein